MTVFAKPVSLIGPLVLQTNQQFVSSRPGSNVTFQIAFTGAPPIQLQWCRNEQPIPDATNSTLLLTNVQLADDGDYSVIASNSFGAVEAVKGVLTILIRPGIAVQPVSQGEVAGGNVTLSVAASGHPLPLSFRWRSNGIPVATLTVYDTNCFFTLSNVQPTAVTNQFRYSVVVTNLAGSSAVSSNAVLTILADTDGDGMADEWEIAHGFDPANATDAILDGDGDGATNAAEYVAGTDPQDPQNQLRLEYARANATNLWIVRFVAVSNRTYTLQTHEALDPQSSWRPIEDVLAASTNRVIEIIQKTDAPTNQQFFRLLTPRIR